MPRFPTALARLLLWIPFACGLSMAPLAAQQPPVPGFDHAHAPWTEVLRACVRDGGFDYAKLKQERTKLDAYLAVLRAVTPTELAGWNEKQRFAFWINTYNAFTIELINSHKERDSIRNINRTLGIAGHGPWREKLVKAGGGVYHLDNVEHDIIRKQWKEPRIHFALVCAAMSCPPLRSEAYTGARLNEQLQDQASLFLTRTPAQNRVDVAKGIFYSSQIMAKYYPRDFGHDDAAIAKYLSQFFPEGPEKAFLAAGKLKLVKTDYDWTLNSQEKAAAALRK